MSKLIWTVFFIFHSKCVLTLKSKIECGYKQCPQTRDGALNVHLVPHSHMDAGWVKTFDEYYFGTRTSVSTANVQLIYHSVLSELLHDKRRKFTFSESAYFWRWWKEQRPTTRATFRSLVQEGRLEFAGGGWVHNDEATVDYLQIIDQFTWGLRKLNDTLGPCGKPKAAWQIDTYGHSREQASLLAQMGFDGLFIGRVDHKQRESMIEEDRMEFMWRGSDVLGKMSDIMTHTLFNLYNAPDGFCFDFLCNDEPIIDDPDNRVYNAEKRVNAFVSQIERQAKYYDHDNIMVTMGGDFTYQSAANWYMNMDKLINHVMTHPANMSDINIFYSTPSCYLKAIYLYGRRDKAVHTERGDFFPYGSDATTYWTGYYTSRPSLKYLAKKTHIFLQVVKQLTVIARIGDSYELHLLRHAVSLVLHHDAITGTSQQHVTNDFIRILSEAIDACTKKVSNLLSYLTPTWGGSRRSKNNQQFVICHELNMSQCRFTETQDSMMLMVYNPLSVKTYFYVRLPATALHYSIRDFNDEEVEYQLIQLPAAVLAMPGRFASAIQELWFEAENIPPLGYSAYYITPVRDQLEENEFSKKAQTEPPPDTEIYTSISNENGYTVAAILFARWSHFVVPTWLPTTLKLNYRQAPTDVFRQLHLRDSSFLGFVCLPPSATSSLTTYIKVNIDKNTGLLESIQHVDGAKIEVSQNFFYYSQPQQTLQSGAYSFRPNKSRPTPVTDRVKFNCIRGSLVKEIRQRFSDWITQVIRLYRGEEFVELEWIIGPVPLGTDLGKEVVSIFKTNISNGGEFFTDSNSRQMMKRTCWNETANHQQKKPIASCFYPVTSRMCIHSLNSSVEVCLLTDRAQGGTSYNDGEMELMVHRRLLTDDGFGLEEPLNEEAYGVGLVVKGKHRVLLGNYRHDVDELTFSERVSSAARRWQLEPWLFLTPGDKVNRRKWQNVRNKRFSAIRLHGLPRHIHVLTLEPWKAGSVLIRLENTLQKPIRGRYRQEPGSQNPEDFSTKPSHITVELKKIFLHMQVKQVRETTLAANQWLDDARQMDWSTRYVYSGADDGIMAEDNVEDTEEKLHKLTDKDSAHYSDEEQTFTRIKASARPKFTDKTRPKVKETPYEYYERKKRSVNSTENLIDTIINHTVNDEQVITNGTTTTPYYETRTETKKDLTETTKTAQVIKATKVSFLNRVKPKRVLPDWVGEGEEVTSSEEDFSNNMKKRSARKRARIMKKFRQEEMADDSDDGITKSIFEMYYKTKTRNVKLQKGSSEEEEKPRRKKKKVRRFKSNTEHSHKNRTRKKYKGRNVDMPFFKTDNGRRHKKIAVDSGEERRIENVDEDGKAPKQKKNREREDIQDYGTEEYLEDNDEYSEKRTRKKRALPKEDLDPNNSENIENEPDYVVTLRPTQIRTFVVWFETNKKT